MKFKGIIPELKMSEGEVTFETNRGKGKVDLLPFYMEKLKSYLTISINTSSLFKGSLELLEYVRKAYPKKFLIRKDFIMIPKQIKESKEAGADAVLIIRDFLTSKQCDELLYACTKENIVPITEVHFKYNLPKTTGPILVNSRYLNNCKFYKKHAEGICKVYKEQGRNVIYASGENSDRVVKEGIADAVLIGTAFMRGELNG